VHRENRFGKHGKNRATAQGEFFIGDVQKSTPPFVTTVSERLQQGKKMRNRKVD